MSKEKKKRTPEEEALKLEMMERVRLAIISKGIPGTKFADQAGIPKPSLRDYRTGKRLPGFEAVSKIIAFSEVSGTWLMTGKGEIFPDKKPADVNEALLARIGMSLEEAFSADSSGEEVHEGGQADFLYSPERKAMKRKLQDAAERAAMAANIYNRIAYIEDEYNRFEQLDREVQSMVRLNQGFDATRDNES